jgi:hypothetical protein
MLNKNKLDNGKKTIPQICEMLQESIELLILMLEEVGGNEESLETVELIRKKLIEVDKHDNPPLMLVQLQEITNQLLAIVRSNKNEKT